MIELLLRTVRTCAIVLVGYSALTGNMVGVGIGLVGLAFDVAVREQADRHRRQHEALMAELRERHERLLADMDPELRDIYESYYRQAQADIRKRRWRR